MLATAAGILFVTQPLATALAPLAIARAGVAPASARRRLR